MSIGNVKKFYAFMREDTTSTKTLEEVNKEMQQKNLSPEDFKKLIDSKIIPLAKEKGLDFTADELINHSKDMVKNLSEED